MVRVEARAPPQELPKVMVELVALAELAELVVLVVLAGLVAPAEDKQANIVEMMMTMMMIPTNAERQGMMGSRPNS